MCGVACVCVCVSVCAKSLVVTPIAITGGWMVDLLLISKITQKG